MAKILRLTGILSSWRASEHGGFGFVRRGGQLFFLHRAMIKSGDPIPGSSCVFTPKPAHENTKHDQATDCVINSRTEAARTTTVPAQPKVKLSHAPAAPRDVVEAIAVLSGGGKK